MEFYQIKPYKYQHTMLKVLETYRALSEISLDFGDVEKKYGIHPGYGYSEDYSVTMDPDRYVNLRSIFEGFGKFFFKDDFDLYEEFNVVFFGNPYEASTNDTIDAIILIKHCRFEKEMFDKMKGVLVYENGGKINIISVISKEDFKLPAYKPTTDEELTRDETEKMRNFARFTKDLCKYYTPNEAIMNNYMVCLNHVMPSYVCYIDAERKCLLDNIDFKNCIAKACVSVGATPFTKSNLGAGKPYLDKERYMSAITKYCEHASLIYDMIAYGNYPMHQNYIPDADEEFSEKEFDVEFSILREYGYASNFANESLVYAM